MGKKGNESYDLLTVFFLALSGFVCIITFMIMGDAISAGPFEPEVPTATVVPLVFGTVTPTPPTPSATPLLPSLTPQPSATWTGIPTSTASFTPTSSPTGAPTITLTWTPSSTPSITNTVPGPTETPVPPTETPVPPTPTATGPTPTFTATISAFPLNVQQGTPLFRDAYLHPGCQWQGFAGQITLQGGAPGLGYVIRVTGDGINGALTQVSGTNTNYGSSGWEVQVGTAPSAGRYSLTVMSSDTTRQLSPTIDLSFPNDCTQNLVLINFVQVAPFE